MKIIKGSLSGIPLFLFALSFQVLFGQNDGVKTEVRTVKCDHYNISDYDKDAQNWNGLYVASNNKIYIGLCTHGDAATVYEFDIATRKIRQLGNLTVILDERGRATWTNGKIHVKMQELDGYVYFGSFCEDNGPPAIDARTYQGSFWLRIRMEDGQKHVRSREIDQGISSRI